MCGTFPKVRRIKFVCVCLFCAKKKKNNKKKKKKKKIIKKKK